MSTDDLDLARQFLDALASAAKSGDRTPLYPFLSPDIQWETPQRELRGIDEVHKQLTWLSPPDKLDLDFGEPEITDHGGGLIVTEVHEIYRVKGSGDFAYARDRRIGLTVRDGKIARYEMRVVG